MKVELRGRIFDKKDLYLIPETPEEEAMLDSALGKREGMDEMERLIAVRYHGMGQHYLVLSPKETTQ